MRVAEGRGASSVTICGRVSRGFCSSLGGIFQGGEWVSRVRNLSRELASLLLVLVDDSLSFAMIDCTSVLSLWRRKQCSEDSSRETEFLKRRRTVGSLISTREKLCWAL